MPVIRAEIDTKIKLIDGIHCPKGRMLIINSRRDHLATRKMATSKIEVLVLSKSKNFRQGLIPRRIAE